MKKIGVIIGSVVVLIIGGCFWLTDLFSAWFAQGF